MAGIGSSIVTLFTIWGAFPTWGVIVYPKLLSFPAWAQNLTALRVAATAIPQTGSFLANATTALVNGTLH